MQIARILVVVVTVAGVGCSPAPGPGGAATPSATSEAAAAAVAAAPAAGAPAAVATPPPAPVISQAVAAAVADPRRSEEDRARDAVRKPAETLAFYDVRPAMRILEMAGGGGYYTTLLSLLVGEAGHVYVTRLRAGDLAATLGNVTPVDELAEVPAGGIDFVFTAQNYHDFVNVGIDRAAMAAAWQRVLRPGGRIGVIDHAAVAGSGAQAVGTLHRIDEAFVVTELAAAGLRPTRHADILRRPDDARTLRVTDDAIRGQTDQFVLEFEVATAAPPPAPTAH